VGETVALVAVVGFFASLLLQRDRGASRRAEGATPSSSRTASRWTCSGCPASCFVLGLDKLIEVKRVAGRPKYLEVLAELVAIRDSRP
jgi:hypothetical protein